MRLSRLAALILVCCPHDVAAQSAAPPLAQRVQRLCEAYWQGFGSAETLVLYHHRLDGPRGIAALADPREIAAGTVRGKPMPYGYGSGIQDVVLENGQLLFALCDAQEATGDAYFAELARRLFAGLRRVATLSPEPGFVPRGPHPDGKSYYRDSSRDQHAAFVEALWRYSRWPLATDEDRRFAADQLDKFAQRMQRNGWQILVEDNSRQAHVGFCWLQPTSIGAASLLSALAQVVQATGSADWRAEYERLSEEKDRLRWRVLLHPDGAQWRSMTLYSNQFAQALEALRRAESDPQRRQQIHDLLRRRALRAIEGNVFDPECWRRLDWAGQQDETQIEPQLKSLGISLGEPATALELHQKFDVGRWRQADTAGQNMYGKLCFGLATVACHEALLCGDKDLVQRVAPTVERMVDQMLALDRDYQQGENLNRATLLGVLLRGCKR